MPMGRLFPLVYEELRRRAHRQLARQGGSATLGTTGLIHETYVKLVESGAAWDDRNHFFGVAVKVMRSVVVDYARRRFAQKRGGGMLRLELDDGLLRVEEEAHQIVMIHEALDRLAAIDQHLADLVELRFFGGLSVEEAAEVLALSERTVKRNWAKARTLLYQLLGEPAAS